MGMRFNFLKTAYDDLAQVEKLEELMEKASEDGWQVHSWQARADGGLTVLMVQPAIKAAPAPMAMMGQRSPRIGSTPTAPQKDPEGGPEIKGATFTPGTKKTRDRSDS